MYEKSRENNIFAHNCIINRAKCRNIENKNVANVCIIVYN